MKIQNQTAGSLIIHDSLNDSVVQWQAGVNNITLTANGSTGDTIDIPNSIADQSAAIQALLADGSLKLLANSTPTLGGAALPNTSAGNGVAFQGVVKTSRDETGGKFRIMFGERLSLDPIVDMAIYGTSVAATTDVVVSAASAIVGTVTATVSQAPTGVNKSGNIIVTFAGTSLVDQAGFTVYSKLA